MLGTLDAGSIWMLIFGVLLNECTQIEAFNVCEHFKPESGPCKAAIPRFFYNVSSRRCEKFLYGGCEGNPNNFETIEDCNRHCRADSHLCYRKPELPFCFLPIVKFFYFNATTGQCQSFEDAGCGLKGNRFSSIEACEKQCKIDKLDACEQPRYAGPCFAAMPRYFYDGKIGQCHKFIYGGCEGNKNNFHSKKACIHRCRGSKHQDRCEEPPYVKGKCSYNVTRFSFSKKGCQAFQYTGCMGNDNRFTSEGECDARCGIPQRD